MFDQFVVLLYRPRDVRNIGAVVRAMKNMGFHRLRLIEPPPFAAADLLGVAHRSEELLAGLEIYAGIDQALAGLGYLVGTSARRHTRPLRRDVQNLMNELAGHATHGPVGLLFGPEDNGLDNQTLARCQALLSLPVDEAYPSLNLAQAVLLALYELRGALLEAPPPPQRPAAADLATLEACVAAWQHMLRAIEFVKSGNPASVLRPLRALLQRAEPDPREAALLTAIARETVKYLARMSTTSATEQTGE